MYYKVPWGVTLEIYLLNQRFINLFSATMTNLVIANIVGILLTVLLSWLIHMVMNMLISKSGVLR